MLGTWLPSGTRMLESDRVAQHLAGPSSSLSGCKYPGQWPKEWSLCRLIIRCPNFSAGHAIDLLDDLGGVSGSVNLCVCTLQWK